MCKKILNLIFINKTARESFDKSVNDLVNIRPIFNNESTDDIYL